MAPQLVLNGTPSVHLYQEMSEADRLPPPRSQALVLSHSDRVWLGIEGMLG